MVTIQQLNRICFTICIVCIVTATVLVLVLIWMPTQSETMQKGCLSILVLFLASLLTIGVARYFWIDRISTTKEIPTPETHILCPKCGQLERREASVCQHCGCKLIPQ